MMSKNIVGYGQKATFVLKPKLYWGIASEIEESQLLKAKNLQRKIYQVVHLKLLVISGVS